MTDVRGRSVGYIEVSVSSKDVGEGAGQYQDSIKYQSPFYDEHDSQVVVMVTIYLRLQDR